MKLSTAFRCAYILVATNEEPYSCDAILRASGGKAPGALLWYRELFTPRVDSPETFWLRGTDLTKEERIAWRLTALAFAATIAVSEERDRQKPSYPSWICAACGTRYGSMPEGHIATWHTGDTCGWCGTTEARVTEPRDYRYPKYPGTSA